MGAAVFVQVDVRGRQHLPAETMLLLGQALFQRGFGLFQRQHRLQQLFIECGFLALQ